MTTAPALEFDDRTLSERGTELTRAAWSGFVARLQRVPPAGRLALGLAALALGEVGPELAWGSYPGFPGEMTLLLQNAFPGGARLYCLILALAPLLLLAPLPRRRLAGIALSGGLTLTTLQTLWAIAADGNSLAAVQAGAWLTLAGGVLGMAAFLTLPDDPPRADAPELSVRGDTLVLAAAYGVGLAVTVYVLALGAANQFLGLVLALVAAFAALQVTGAIAAVAAAVSRRPVVSYLLLGLTTVAFPFTQRGNQHWLNVGAEAVIFAAAAIGLNVVVGLAGLLDLGYVAFFGIGAYVAAEFSGAQLGPEHGHLPYLLVIALAAIVAGLVGVVIGAPTLRLRGDYLAIVTLGFGEIFNQVANNSNSLDGGPNGVSAIPNLGLGSFSFGATHSLFGVELPYFANYYYGGLVLVVVVMVVFSRLSSSRVGRAWVAIREDEIAAASMGINTTALKLLAFGIGAFLAGGAGSLNAHLATSVTPDGYVFLNSAFLLAAVVLGGMGSVTGPIVGSLLLFVIPEKLRPFGDYRLLIFGLALVLMMILRPEGIIVNRRRAREFHGPAGPDALSAPPGSGVAT